MLRRCGEYSGDVACDVDWYQEEPGIKLNFSALLFLFTDLPTTPITPSSSGLSDCCARLCAHILCAARGKSPRQPSHPASRMLVACEFCAQSEDEQKSLENRVILPFLGLFSIKSLKINRLIRFAMVAQPAKLETAEVIKSLKSLSLFGAYDSGYARAAASGGAAERAPCERCSRRQYTCMARVVDLYL